MMELVMLVPTRGRPKNAERLDKACRELNRANTKIVFGVDEDDPELDAYRDVVPVHVTKPGSPGMVGALNQLAGQYWDGALNLGFMGDDHCPRTAGWDEHLCKALEGQLGGVAYGNDLIQGPNLPTAVAMDSWIPKTLGYMAPPVLKHLYVDNVWRDWGVALNKIAYLHDVIIEHIHPLVGKAPQDERYAVVNHGNIYNHDHAAYEEYIGDQFITDIRRLQDVLR